MASEWMDWGSLLLGVLLVVVVGLGYLQKAQGKRALPPGPSGWPVLGSLSLLGTKPHQSLCKLSKKYGPIMHVELGTMDTVVASSSKIAREFLKSLDANFSNRPENAVAKYLAYNSNDLAWAPYGPRWRMLRKVWNIHLFAGKALEDLHEVREGEVRLLVRSITDQRNTAVKLGELLNVCTANVLGQIMLSKRVFDSPGAQAIEFREMGCGAYGAGRHVQYRRLCAVLGVDGSSGRATQDEEASPAFRRLLRQDNGGASEGSR